MFFVLRKRQTEYTDSLRRKWRWSDSLQKYEYVRKDGRTASELKGGSASSVVSPSKIKEKKKKAVQDSPRTVSKKKLYNSLSPELQKIASTLGVLPFDKEAADYVVSNHEELFQKAAAAHSKGKLPVWVSDFGEWLNQPLSAPIDRFFDTYFYKATPRPMAFTRALKALETDPSSWRGKEGDAALFKDYIDKTNNCIAATQKLSEYMYTMDSTNDNSLERAILPFSKYTSLDTQKPLSAYHTKRDAASIKKALRDCFSNGYLGHLYDLYTKIVSRKDFAGDKEKDVLLKFFSYGDSKFFDETIFDDSFLDHLFSEVPIEAIPTEFAKRLDDLVLSKSPAWKELAGLDASHNVLAGTIELNVQPKHFDKDTPYGDLLKNIFRSPIFTIRSGSGTTAKKTILDLLEKHRSKDKDWDSCLTCMSALSFNDFARSFGLASKLKLSKIPPFLMSEEDYKKDSSIKAMQERALEHRLSFAASAAATRSAANAKQVVQGKRGTVSSPEKMFVLAKADNEEVIKDKIESNWDIFVHGSMKPTINHVFEMHQLPAEPTFQKLVEERKDDSRDKEGSLPSVVTTNNKLTKNGTRYLYHGTDFTAGMLIAQSRFKLGKLKVGRMLGDGIYLADKSSKSCQYFASSGVSRKARGVMFLCEAAVGTEVSGIKETAGRSIYFQKYKKDNLVHTIVGVKGNSLKNNEWCVKDPNAVIPRLWMDITVE